MSHLDNLGFNIDSQEAFDILVTTVLEQGTQVTTAEGIYVVYRDKSGAEIYAQLDVDGEFIGFMPFYDNTLKREFTVDGEISYVDATALDRRYIAKSKEGTYPFVFDVVNAEVRFLDQGNKENLSFVAFPQEITYFSSLDAFMDEFPELSKTYFIPVGLLTEEGEAQEVPEPYAMFIGEINRVERKSNQLGKEDFYALDISILEADMTVVVSVKALNKNPEVGGFVNGVFWLGAKV